MFLVSWGPREKDYGVAHPIVCERCRTETGAHFVKRRRWIRPFMIPMVPYTRAHHYAVCEACGYDWEISDREAYQEMVRISKAYADGDVTKSEYLRRIETLHPDGENVSFEKASAVEPEATTA